MFKPENHIGLIDQKTLHLLRLYECVEVRGWLTKRIRVLRNMKNPKVRLEDLELSVRAFNILKAQQLHTIKDVRDFGFANILLLKNAGPKTVGEIKKAVAAAGRKNSHLH